MLRGDPMSYKALVVQPGLILAVSFKSVRIWVSLRGVGFRSDYTDFVVVLRRCVVM